MPPELGAYDCSSTGCRADKAYHGTLDEQPARQVGDKDDYSGTECKGADLYEQQGGVPAAGLEFCGFDFAEGEEQHAEDKRGLQYSDGLIDEMPGTFEAGDTGVDEVENYA